MKSELQSRVSIIVPIYNVEKYIERCVVSLFDQTYSDIEFVFVDDCSPDRSIDILNQVLERYPERAKNTSIIRHTVNRGLAAARNTGLNSCNGTLVWNIDSDDYVELDAVEKLVRKQIETGADIVTGLMIKHGFDKDSILSSPKYRSKSEMVLDMMQLTINHFIVGRLIRKSLFDDNGIRAQEGVNIGEDCWFMTRLAYYAKSFAFLDDVVYHYDFTRDNSYMSKPKGKMHKKKHIDDIATAKMIIDFFKDKEEQFYDEANKLAMSYLGNVLFLSARCNDKPFFYEVLSHMKTFDQKYWDSCNWNKDYWRVMSKNYYSCKMLASMLKLYSKIALVKRP